MIPENLPIYPLVRELFSVECLVGRKEREREKVIKVVVHRKG